MRRLPLPSVASACFSSSYWCEPSGMFFFGLKVFDERLPLWGRKQVYCLLLPVNNLIVEEILDTQNLLCVLQEQCLDQNAKSNCPKQ